MKVGIVGAGAVGSSCLLSLMMRGCAREIVLVDRNRKRALGIVTDAQYGSGVLPAVDLLAGDYSDLAGAALVMITAGANEQAGGATDRHDPWGRLRLLKTNADIFEEIVPRIRSAAPETLILVVTDPPDPLTDVVRLLGHDRVLSTGTFLDSLRFRFHVARRFKVNPASVEAQVIGEHGTSEVFLWSSARVGGRPVLESVNATERAELERDVRYANITVIEGIGASQYGIGMVSARIAEMILRDERAVIPIGSYISKYGVTLSLPSVLGRDGVLEVIEPEMSGDERQSLSRSAETLKKAVASVELSAPRSVA
ncbi:MAG: lactate dehydrogenase [Bryobacterales bacterium]|nr:lactate dehydrogenase [Bryobacterales bacterium]